MKSHFNEILAVIPARGGSKGIPKKNLRILGNLPLIAHSIIAAKACQRVTRVVVSSDSNEICDVAKTYGAEAISRPLDISGDLASSELSLLHTLNELKTRDGYVPELIIFLQCTSPFTTSEDIDGLITQLETTNADSAFTAAPFHRFLWRQDASGTAEAINHQKEVRPMRQEREPQFIETGAAYAMQTEGFLKARYRFFGKTVFYILPEERALEIDSPADLHFAELLSQSRQIIARPDPLPVKVEALIMDFDGVFTDNSVWQDETGRESVQCSRADGMGLSQLRRKGLPMLVLSTEVNPIVKARCSKVNVECLQAISDKLATLRQWTESRNINLSNVVYLGNDINDLECMATAGCSVVVADAEPAARAKANLILKRAGGKGAIRELADLLVDRVKLSS